MRHVAKIRLYFRIKYECSTAQRFYPLEILSPPSCAPKHKTIYFSLDCAGRHHFVQIKHLLGRRTLSSKSPWRNYGQSSFVGAEDEFCAQFQIFTI